MDFGLIRSEVENAKNKITELDNLPKGLSVIIPVHDGDKYIEKCLESFLEQKIIDANFEIILVFNGVFAKTLNFIYKNKSEFEKLDLLILINEKQGPGAARNLGIEYAKYSHLTFVDVDDYISDTFIQANYNHLYRDTISISQIHDVNEGEVLIDNVINSEVLNNYQNKNISYCDVKRILTITACKALPTKYFKVNYFKEHLRSGEDTVLFTELLVTHQPSIHIIPFNENAVYYRILRNDSVSRQDDSFDFLIRQRLDILEILDPLLSIVSNETLKKIIVQKYDAQIMFMNRYLKNNIEEHANLVDLIDTYNFNHFKYNLLNRNISDTLIISYCFSPYSDTSASVVAKRIVNQNDIVDVISNNMNGKRKIDNSLKKLVDPFVGRNTIINKPVTFSNFEVLKDFIDKAFLTYLRDYDRYKKLYTRAMFPISHFPGLFIKIFNEDIFWEAEFSDPLLIDIKGDQRYHNIESEQIVRFLKEGLLGDFSEYVDENLFNLVELIPFALADRLIFTNENQLEFMIERFPEKLKTFIRNKSIISKHPTLAPIYYDLVESNLNLEESKINIAYFGNFYKNRSLREITKVVESFQKDSYVDYEVAIFTNVESIAKEDLETLKTYNVRFYNTVNYLEFLNLCKRFDGLLVFDTKTADIKSYNPYLPSKISDYIGTDSKIISINEKGSPLDRVSEENLFKFYYSDDEFYNFENLNKALLKDKNILLIKKEDSSTIRTPFYELDYSNSLELNGDPYNWYHKVKDSPISFDKKYQVQLKNLQDEEIRFRVESNYSKKDIINLIFRTESIETIYCISHFNENKEMVISPGETLEIEWNFAKEYKKPSFLKASILKLAYIGSV